jgi:hypothetical protein
LGGATQSPRGIRGRHPLSRSRRPRGCSNGRDPVFAWKVIESWPLAITRRVAPHTSSRRWFLPFWHFCDHSWAAPLATQSSFEISGAQIFSILPISHKNRKRIERVRIDWFSQKSTNRLVFAIANYFSR